MIRKYLMVILLAVVMAVIAGCGGKPTPKPVPTPATTKSTAEGRGDSGSLVTASGVIAPAQKAQLSFTLAGRIKSIQVAVGDQVKADQVLAQLDDAMLNAQQSQAEANLAAAQARLNQLKHSPTAEELAAAQQNLASAQAVYDSLLHPTENEIRVLRADCDKAKALLSQAQAAYDRIGGDTNPYADMTPQRAQLQMAWLDYQKAESLYNNRINPTNSQIQQALAGIQNAKYQLARLQPTADDLAATQASVNAAQAARDLAAEQLKNAKLVAPFSGTVAALDVNPNETILPGQTVLSLADLSKLQVETTDLSERAVSRVAIGQSVSLHVKPLNANVNGKVVRVAPRANKVGGDVVYAVTIELAEKLQGLSWGMSVDVEIESTSKP
ncbi:MAG: HlyD family efflux transporter periplasmic adaptor subunit [Chloroflexi bacterium]|nr:HlyD family efflux transporter periplasmic adaptor subunit [Chloroflexota bacterium]